MVTFLGVKNTSFQSNCSSDSSFSVKYLIEVGGVLNFLTNFVYILLQVNNGIDITELCSHALQRFYVDCILLL